MSVADRLRRVAAQVEAAARAHASAGAGAGSSAAAAAAAAGVGAGAGAGACGVRLVAVSKLHSLASIAEAVRAGARALGENYVAEAVSKARDPAWAQLAPAPRLHFIGTLQSNKARALVAGAGAALWAVESVDSTRLAGLLQRAAAEVRPAPPAAPPLRVFVQVNTSGEAAKGGVPPGGAADLARYIIDSCPALRLQGLMTIGAAPAPAPTPGAAPAPDRACFDCLAAERTRVLAALDAAGIDRARYGPARLPGDAGDEGVAAAAAGGDAAALELSMGMSGDFELAIACGSTSVRVGSSIFGERPAKEARVDSS